MAELKDRLKYVREHIGITQHELAKRSILTPQLINELEQGKNDPHLSHLFQLAQALGVKPEWLAFGSGDAPFEIKAEPEPINVPVATRAERIKKEFPV